MAVGTNAGKIEIYLAQTLDDKLPFRYYDYSIHHAPVVSFGFIPFNVDYYLASVC